MAFEFETLSKTIRYKLFSELIRNIRQECPINNHV